MHRTTCLEILASVLFFLLETYRSGARDFGPSEFCHRETFNASCSTNEVIVMQMARYGRMSLGKCVRKDLGYLGCAVDVLGVLDSRCSGHSSCSMRIQDDALYQTQPCPDDTTAYLQASYSCLQVAVDENSECRSHGAIERTERVGVLATHITEKHGWGGAACPWVLKVPTGQRINITLFNFARVGGSELLASDPSVCYELATIHEENHPSKNILTCGTDHREKNVFVSETNKVEIRLVDRSLLSNLGKFLLQHEAIGCPDIKVPRGAYLKTDGLTAVIHCNDSDETWYLTCRGNKWVGNFANCTAGFGGIFSSSEQFPYGILIVVAIGVALGVFFGGLLLSLAIFYLKRQQAKKDLALRESQSEGFADPKDLADERAAQWANYAAHPHYAPNHPAFETLPSDPRDMDKEMYTHGRMYHPNDYGPRNHIYESPHFT